MRICLTHVINYVVCVRHIGTGGIIFYRMQMENTQVPEIWTGSVYFLYMYMHLPVCIFIYEYEYE